jgi:hypothetical protein
VAESFDSATDKLNPRLLLSSTRNIHEANSCILVDAQHRVVNQLDSSSTAVSHMYGVAFTQLRVKLRSTPASASALDIDLTFDAHEPPHRIPAKILCVDTGSEQAKGKGEYGGIANTPQAHGSSTYGGIDPRADAHSRKSPPALRHPTTHKSKKS